MRYALVMDSSDQRCYSQAISKDVNLRLTRDDLYMTLDPNNI